MALPNFKIHGVDAGGVDLDEDFTGTSFGIVEVFILELGGRAVFVQDDGFHQGNTSVTV